MNVNSIRPISNNNSISVRISNPKTNKIYGNKNNRSINTQSNNIISFGNITNVNNNSSISNNINYININNDKLEKNQANNKMDLM